MATHFTILAWKIPRDRGAWWATVNGVAKSHVRLFATPLTVAHQAPLSLGSLVGYSQWSCKESDMTE